MIRRIISQLTYNPNGTLFLFFDLLCFPLAFLTIATDYTNPLWYVFCGLFFASFFLTLYFYTKDS